MANYNVTLSVGSGKGAFATFSATNGDGLAYNDPLDVNIGDTVTFIRASGSTGTAKFRDLTIFTSNANIDIASGGSNVVRTVASGGALLDSITGKNGGESQSDTFFFERQAASSDTTPTAFNFTNQTGVTRSSTRTSANTVTIAGMDSGVSTAVTISGGTYSKNGGSYTSASTTASNGTTFKVRHTSSSSYSTNTTTTLTVGGVSGSFVSTTEAAPATAPAAPTNLTFSTTGTATAASVSVTASGGGTGTLKVSPDGSTWSANGTSFGSRTRGTEHTWYARVESTLNSSNYTEPHTPDYLDPATGTAANDIILSGASSHTASISGGAAGTVYEFRSGSHTGTILATVNGNDDATCSGGAGTYYVTHYKTTGTGGSGETGRANLTTYTVTAVSKRTFTIQINYVAGNSQDAPTLLGPTVTVDTGSKTGSVTSSTNPLEVSVGDDVIWKRSHGLNIATVSGLEDFTDNSNISVTQAGVTRTLANGSNGADQMVVQVSAGGGSDSDYFYIERVGGITPPSGLSAGLDGAESQTEKVTLSQSTDGSGGTLEYLQRSVTSMASSGWQTSNEFYQTRNTTRYYWVSRNKNSDSYEGPLTVTVNYLGAVTTGYSFDTASGNIGYGDGAPAISFTAAQANHTVAVFEGSTRRSNGVTGATDHNNIATNETPPAGGSKTYNLRTYRNQNAGGNPSLPYVATTATTTASTIEIKRYPQTPTLGYSDDSASVESPTTSATLTLTNTDGASTYWFRRVNDGTAFGDYVQDSDNEVTYADQTRAANQAYDYQGRIRGANNLFSESAVINAQQLTKRYLDPKPFSYSTPATISYTATSHVLTITGADSDHTYGWGIGAVGKGNATYTNSSTITISSSSPLPEPGEQEDYVVSVRRGTASGGQNNLVSQTTPVNVKRYPQAPSGLTTFTDGGAEAASGTFTIAVGNLDGATATAPTLSTSITLSPNYTTNAVANGSDIASVVRAGDIVYARNTGSNGLTASAAIPTPATYLLPNTPSLPNVSNAYNTANHSVDITSMPTTVYYEVRTESYTGTLRGASTTGGGGSSKSINVTQINTGGDTVTYYVRGYRLETAGGDEHWDNLGTYTVTEAGNTAASAFTFNPNSPVGLGLSQISNLITIAGLSTGTSANFSITGGTYSKNGAPDANTNGTAVNGDTFKVKHTSSSSYSTSVTTTLTVGGTSGSFVSTTVAPTLAPNTFTFTDESPVARGLPQTSNLITVAGLSSGYSTSVSVSGGTYSKNGGAYTSATDNTVVNGDTFRVKHTSSSVVSTAVNTTLTIGGVSDTYTTTTTSSYCPTTNTTHTITGITTTSSGTLSQSNIVSSNNVLICSLTTPYVWLDSFNPGSAATRSNIVSVSVTSGGGNVSLNRTNNSTAHTITYTPPAITTESTAVIQVQHRKQIANYIGDSGSYQWPNLNQGTLTTVNITVTICPVSQTSVSITSVDDITPVENSTDVITASPVTASGVTISSYAWTSTNTNVISLSSSTVQSPTLTFGNVTSNQTATIGVTVTDSTGATATASQAYTVQFVNQAPVSSLTGSSSVLVNTAANFDGSTSYDPDGATITYAFLTTIAGQTEDSQSASSTSTYSFTPTSAGQYTVALTVSDGIASTTSYKSLLAVTNASETTTSAGGYGFEVYTAGGSAIIRSDELLIRKVAVATANSSGVASATITGTEAGTLVLGTTAGEDNAGVQLTVTGTTTKSVSITGALANERIHLYLLR